MAKFWSQRNNEIHRKEDWIEFHPPPEVQQSLPVRSSPLLSNLVPLQSCKSSWVSSESCEQSLYLFYFIFILTSAWLIRNIMSTVHHTKLQINGPSGHCSHLDMSSQLISMSGQRRLLGEVRTDLNFWTASRNIRNDIMALNQQIVLLPRLHSGDRMYCKRSTQNWLMTTIGAANRINFIL